MQIGKEGVVCLDSAAGTVTWVWSIINPRNRGNGLKGYNE